MKVKIIKNRILFLIICLSVTWHPIQEYFAHMWRRQPIPSIKTQFFTSINKISFFYLLVFFHPLNISNLQTILNAGNS